MIFWAAATPLFHRKQQRTKIPSPRPSPHWMGRGRRSHPRLAVHWMVRRVTRSGRHPLPIGWGEGRGGAFHRIRFVSFCKPAPARLNDRKNCIVSAPFLHHFFISLWCSFVPPTNARASARRIRVPRSAFRVGPSCDLKFRAMVCSHCRAHPNTTTRFLRKSRRQGSAAQSSGNGRQRDAIERQRHAPIFQRNNLTEFRAAPVRCRPGHRLVESCRARLFREENRGPI